MKTFVFVYNAPSGKLNAMLDTMHKIISPKTYACHLCMITYGAFSMKPSWHNLIKHSKHTFKFYHSDEFIKSYPQISETYPCVFILEAQLLKIWIPSKELNELSLEALIEKIKKES